MRLVLNLANDLSVGPRIDPTPPGKGGWAALLSRVSEIALTAGGRPAVVPQSYHDYVQIDAADDNTHPHMGTFTHTAVKSGNWSDPTLWNTGSVPGANAIVNTSTFDVMYDLESDVLINGIHVSGRGTLRWDASKDTRLWVDTVMVHGTLIIGEPSAPVPESSTAGKPRAEIVFWQAEAPLTTVRLGLNTMGPVRIQGANKKHWLRATASVLAGATSATFDDVDSSGWRVGDTILFAATESAGTSPTDAQYTGPTQFYGPMRNDAGIRTQNQGFRLSQDEERVITGISGNVVSWADGLSFNHNLYTGTLPRGQVITIPPIVANKSRSVQFRTAGGKAGDTEIWGGANLATRQKRAHSMFMFSDDIQVRGLRALDMGRTDTDPSLVAPIARIDSSTPAESPFTAFDKAPGDATRVAITDPLNVRGRYPIHIHGTGAFFGRKQVVVENCVADASPGAPPIPGWAMTHHNSRAAFEKCVVHNVRGAGMVSELGNEIGQWIDNLVCHARGDAFEFAFGSRAEWWQNHNGHYGAAYENQARQILMQGNHATSCRVAYAYMQQDIAHALREVDYASLRYRDPIAVGISGPWKAINPEQPQIPDFNNNTSAGCGLGLYVEHRLNNLDRQDETPMLMHGFHNINTGSPFRIANYSQHYHCADSLFHGFNTGVSVGSVAIAFNFSNLLLREGTNGFVFEQSNYNGFIVDVAQENVINPYNSEVVAISTANEDPTQHPFYNMLDEWVVTNNDLPSPGYTVRTRQHRSLNSQTDLPQIYPRPPLGRYMPEGSPPVAYGGQPYFLLDAAASDLTVAAGNVVNQVLIVGTLRDSVGDWRFGDYQNSETPLANYSVKNGRPTPNLTGEALVVRNGCFNDGGTWKSRLWFTYADRATGEYFFPFVDVTLTGFSADFLNANLVAPETTKPSVPLKPETLRSGPVVLPSSAPTINAPSSFLVTDNQPLALVLQSNEGQAKWAISGGADAARFEIFENRVLRFAGNAVKAIASPDDADANSIYEVVVRATNPFNGLFSTMALQGTLQYFIDTFDGPVGSLLTERTGWFLNAGSPNSMILDGIGNLNRPNSGAASIMRSYDLPSYDQAADVVFAGNTGSSRVALRLTDEQNYIILTRNSSPNVLILRQNKAGVITELARYSQANTTSTYTVEVVGNNVRVLRDGAVQPAISGGPAAAGATVITMSDPVPASYSVGLVGVAGNGAGPWLSSVKFRPVV